MENIMLGFANVFQLSNLLVCIGGLFVGILFGALPGFSATMAVAIFVPFTYVMEPGAALLLLSALYCGGVFGGSIPAVLVGIPGTPASAPTALEGKALVKRGEAGRALNLVTLASCFGGFVSSVALLICAPLLAKIAKMVGQPEQMFVAVFGLSVVVMLSQENLFKGLMVAFISLLLATFGQDPVEGFPRFTYGLSQLTGGFSVVPVLIGLFSLPEVFKMLEDPLGKMAESGKVGSLKLKITDVTHNMFNAIRSTIIGVCIGIIPAAGPDIAAFLCYNEAKKASKEPEKFGNGSPEGIVAAEGQQRSNRRFPDPASDAGDSRKRSGGDLSGRHDHPRRTAGSDTFYPACGDGVYHDHRFCADQRSDVFCGYVLLQVRKPDSGDSQIDSGNGDRSAGSSGYLCDQQKYV